jgi:hypothetical protein
MYLFERKMDVIGFEKVNKFINYLRRLGNASEKLALTLFK